MFPSWVLLLLIASAAADKPPNIVILLADDMGWNDVGIHGSEVPTPNIDALAYNGIVLKRHYAQPSCTPSRAALLTGQYPMRYGLHGYPLSSDKKDGLPADLKLMPQVLKELGYRTHLVGKWHLGYSTWSQMPTRRGFDHFYGYLNGFLGYNDGVHYDPPSIGLDFRSNEEESWRSAYNKYLPLLLSEKADELVRNHSRTHREKPFFMLLAANAPHAGGNRPFIDEHPPTRNNDTRFIADKKRRIFADVMRYVDNTLGSLTATLKSEGMLNDTIILFLADNGGPSIDPLWHYDNAASNYPLRGTKMSVFEGGVRGAAILWKSDLKSISREYNELFHITDWLPTFNSAAGGEKLENLDGVDHWATLMGQSAPSPRKELLVEISHEGDSWGYISENYKLVKSYNSSYKLSFSNNYFSPAPQENPAGYQIRDVINSPVAKAIGSDLNETACLEFRQRLLMSPSCTSDQMEQAAAHDCSVDGCLFDIHKDHSECFDISKQQSKVMSMLQVKMNYYRGLVKELDPPAKNWPNSRNYFAPSSAVMVNPIPLLAFSFFALLAIINHVQV